MKRETLENLGLNAEQINAVMKENGNDINHERSKFADYEEIKKQLESASATLEKFKDYDQVKAEVQKWQQEAEKAKTEAAEKVKHMELQQKIKDFTSEKKFVNSFTRDAINAQLEAALSDVANAGKSLDEVLAGITEGKDGVFIEENPATPPKVPNMNGDPNKENGVLAAFKAMNPNIKI